MNGIENWGVGYIYQKNRGESMVTKILIGADIVPTKSNMQYFTNGNAEYLVGKDLLNILDDADYSIMNLETPLTDIKSEIVKCGPCLCANTTTVTGLKRINPHFYTLANNHILDQDVQGLESTIQCLKLNNIAFAGVGNTKSEAAKPYIALINGISVGIYCCAEHEFSIVSDEKAGANPYDALYSFDHVRDLKGKVDIVIVLFHGGKEHYRYPSPELRRIFRKFVESGADYVIAQHTHCVGCIERYMSGTLVYGQGNFLFDNSDSDYWATSILLRIIINDNKEHSLEVLPLMKKKECVRLASGNIKDAILKSLIERSESIQKKGFIDKEYVKYSEEMRKEYYLRLLGSLGRNFIVRMINKLTRYRFLDLIYKRTSLIVIENCFDCEAHRELISQITKRYRVNE